MRQILVFLWLLSACTPHSFADFRCDGEARMRAFIEDLHKIHNREELVRAEPLLKRHFESLIDLMIEARTYQERHPDESPDNIFSDVSASFEEELRRIYAIEGGREVVEQAQQEPLVRLDAFERACAKKKQFFKH